MMMIMIMMILMMIMMIMMIMMMIMMMMMMIMMMMMMIMIMIMMMMMIMMMIMIMIISLSNIIEAIFLFYKSVIIHKHYIFVKPFSCITKMYCSCIKHDKNNKVITHLFIFSNRIGTTFYYINILVP